MVSRLTAFGAGALVFASLMLVLRPHAAAQDRGRAQPGDLNYNGRVDFYDIRPCVVALFDPGEWRNRYRRSQRQLLDVADFDGNGAVDSGDIHGFAKAMVRAGGGGGDGAGPGGGGGVDTPGSVDLDVDSDNNDATNLPGRTEPEDLIEDDPNETGKFVLVNDDDDDRDGNPDKDQNGAIEAERDDLVPLVLEITPGSEIQPFEFLDYRLNYPANVRLWRSALRGDLSTDVVVSGTIYQQQVWILGDMNGSGQMDSFDIEPFLLALFDPDAYAIQFPGIDGVAVGDMNGDGALDSFDIEAFLDALFGGITSYVPLRMWIEGLDPSATKADTRFVADSDTDNNGSFESDDAVRTTILSLTPSPASGPLGTAVTWTLDPAIAPVRFDALTTAEWSGFFAPVVGPPSDPFIVTYSVSQFRESAEDTAIVVVGDGAGIPAVPREGTPPGSFVGTFTITFSAFQVLRSFDFDVPDSAIDWFAIDYPQDEFGYLNEPPSLASAALDVIPIYEAPTAGTTPEFLRLAVSYHVACVFLLDENPTTTAEAPPTILVDLVTFDANGTEVDSVSGVVLTQDTDDGDPDHLTYHSDLATPLVFVEGMINKQMFTEFIILFAAEDGKAVAIESQP